MNVADKKPGENGQTTPLPHHESAFAEVRLHRQTTVSPPPLGEHRVELGHLRGGLATVTSKNALTDDVDFTAPLTHDDGLVKLHLS